ncbi:sensor histidine kinase [Flagellimonas onchidii]|uniref:sensor histidine kinase n=1 Tax=Flagellimonas onchidii TaxID=2562684 RepID=UPI0010A6315E|nr:histidine kinase [Allomuricauda onchidii]
MINKIRFIAISFFYVIKSQSTLFSQEINLVDKENSATHANFMALDHNGFLWYSIFNGVVQYTGTSHIIHKFEHPDNKSIYKTEHLFFDSKNNLWASTKYGVWSLNLKDGVTNWYTPKYNRTDYVSFLSAKEDQHGNLWFSTTTSEIIKRGVAGKWSRLGQQGAGALFSIFERTDEKMLSKKEIGIYYNTMLNKEDSELSYFDDKVDNTILTENGRFFPKKTSGHYIYKNLQYRYHYLPSLGKQIVEFPYRNIRVTPYFDQQNPFNNKFFWHKSNDTIFRSFLLEEEYSKVNFKAIDTVITTGYHHYFLPGKDNTLFINANKTIYIEKPNVSKPFEKYLANDRPISCRSIVETKKGILVSTHSGFFIKKKGNRNFEQVVFSTKTGSEQLLKNFTLGTIKVNDTTIFAYGYANSIQKINLNTRTFLEVKIPDHLTFPGFFVSDMETISANKYLLSGNFGLYMLDVENNSFRNIGTLGNAVDISGKYVQNIFYDQQGNVLWLSLLDNGGAYSKDLKTGEINHYSNKESPFPLPDNNVNLIYKDKRGTIWFGTRNGLLKLDSEPRYFTENDGLFNDNITEILESDTGLWLSTYDGLVHLNFDDYSIETFFEENGITNNEFNTKSAMISKSGDFYFGGINGITKFNPNNFNHKKNNPRLFLVDMQIYDRKENKKKYWNLELIKVISLKYDKNHLSMSFAINRLLNPNKHKYEYRFKNLSEQWIDIGASGKVNLLGLSPGKYELEVKGFDEKGNPSNILSYSIYVEEFFFKSKLFIFSAFLTMGGLVFFWVSNYNKRLKDFYREKALALELKSKLLQIQMSPHLTFNMLGSIENAIVLKKGKVVNEYIGKLSSLLRLTLDICNEDKLSIAKEIEYLKAYLYLQKIRLNNQLEYKIEVDSNLDLSKEIESMVLQPIVENAIIHGLKPKENDRVLLIKFKKTESYLQVVIQDNGIGRKESLKYKTSNKSWSTKVIKERITLKNNLNQRKITYKTIDLTQGGHPSGTKVFFYFPI